MVALKNEDGDWVTDWKEVEEIYKKFYTNLSALLVHVPAPQIHVAKQQALHVLINEVRNAAFLESFRQRQH